MRFRTTLTFFTLAMGWAFALPARAQPKIVAPTLRSAQKRATGILPVKGHGQDGHGTSMSADLKVSATTAAGTSPGLEGSPAKPLTQEQVVGMVRDGFGDESGAKLIEQRGIDFAPSEDFYQTLKAAGASETFLNALRAAKPPEPASAKKPINQVQVFALLTGQVPSHRVTMLVEERGVDFEPTDDYLQEVRLAGGEDELITALRGAKVTKPATIDPAAQARQAEILRHVARGAEFWRNTRYADAEAEYRAAIHLDPQNADLHGMLAPCLSDQGKNDEAVAEAREALRLAPTSERAHYGLGYALDRKGDSRGAEAELREALRLSPNDDNAHVVLGLVLYTKGDCDGGFAEAREGIRLNPESGLAHSAFGAMLGWCKGEWDEGISEMREGLHLYPNCEWSHIALGGAFRARSDWDGAIAEYREALRLNPNNESTHNYLGIALGGQRDWDSAIAEFREALRLNPDFAETHSSMGFALVVKGDLDGAIAELREALRLDPNNGGAHFGLANTMERKGDRRGALEECRAAYMLDPKNVTYKQNYERLLQRVNQ